MAQLTAYEVQCYSGGTWVIQSIFDDRELALMEARRMEESGLRRQETRVVKEVHDLDRDKTRSQVIYESPMVRTQLAPEERQQAAPKRAPAPAGKKPASPAGKRRKPAKKAQSSGPSVLTITLSAIGLFGVAFGALYVLRMMG